MFTALKTRLLHELKASAGKSAVLGLLLLVGFYLWIPPLLRAIAGGRSTSPAEVATIAAAALLPPPGADRSQSGVTWDRTAEILESDPLLRSADVAAMGSDPFRIDQGQFSPPILFADDSPRAAVIEETGAKLPDDVVLLSTIVGSARRAALINGKLYQEGASVILGGESYRLEEVHPRRAILTRGGKSFELKIPLPPGLGADSDPVRGEPRRQG